MIVLSQNKDILVDCESVAVDKNRDGEGFVLIARTSNCETVVGHFENDQDAKAAIHSLLLCHVRKIEMLRHLNMIEWSSN